MKNPLVLAGAAALALAPLLSPCPAQAQSLYYVEGAFYGADFTGTKDGESENAYVTPMQDGRGFIFIGVSGPTDGGSYSVLSSNANAGYDGSVTLAYVWSGEDDGRKPNSVRVTQTPEASCGAGSFSSVVGSSASASSRTSVRAQNSGSVIGGAAASASFGGEGRDSDSYPRPGDPTPDIHTFTVDNPGRSFLVESQVNVNASHSVQMDALHAKTADASANAFGGTDIVLEDIYLIEVD